MAVRNTKTLMNKITGRPISTATIYAYTPAGSSTSALYGAVLIGTYSNNGDGTYYLDSDETVVATLVIVTAAGTTIVRDNVKSVIIIGSDQVELTPPTT